jgi:hypothetical protein
MKVRKPSQSRLKDDGYEAGRAGRPALGRESFETAVDYHIYMDGYNKGASDRRPSAASSSIGGVAVFHPSGMSVPLGLLFGSGTTLREPMVLYELGRKTPFRLF